VINLNREIPVEKNKEYNIEVTGMGYEGEGVGRVDGFTVFIQGALVGETVNVKIIKVTKNYAVGKLLEVIKPSINRSVPVCDIFSKCGGCQIQHLSYNGQLVFKRQRVVDAMTRIGKLEEVEVHNTIGMATPFRYRNKVQLPIGEFKGEVQIGFYASKSHNIVDMEQCFIQDEISDKIVELTRQWIKKNKIAPYNEERHDGVLRHLMIRRAFKTGEVMVVVVTKSKQLPHADELVDLLVKNIEGIKGIIHNINNERTNVILGNKFATLWGEDFITDYIGKFKFRISPLSFFQVNPVQTEVLYNKALEYAKLSGDEIVFDAYCGAGTISLFLAQKAKKVYGVEIVPEAIENAVDNAKENGVKNVEFIVGKSEEVIPDIIKRGIKADVVVVDPPRKGCEKELLDAIASINPKRIVYVSCDPGTLARDLGILDELGYRTLEVQPVDMFPQTAHVEVVVLLERK
jgi:23S rRNA (uracil1939-C5)-methyltransferase